MRYSYFYNKNGYKWYKFWHRSQFMRDIHWAWKNWKHRQWCKYGKRHLLWLHTTDEYYDEMVKKPIWPQYGRDL